MKQQQLRAEDAAEEFLEHQDYRSYQRMMRLVRALIQKGGVPESLEGKVATAVLLAAESSDWRTASSAIEELPYHVDRAYARRADIIARGLLSRYRSVRFSSWISIVGPRLARLVLSRLERERTEDLMLWEVLEAIQKMLGDLSAEKDHERVLRLVRRMERVGTRSPLVTWIIDETLYSERYLNQTRGEESHYYEYYKRQPKARKCRGQTAHAAK